MEGYERDRRQQIEHEIQWLRGKLKTVKKPKHRKELEHQLKERELNLAIGVFSLTPSINNKS